MEKQFGVFEVIENVWDTKALANCNSNQLVGYSYTVVKFVRQLTAGYNRKEAYRELELVKKSYVPVIKSSVLVLGLQLGSIDTDGSYVQDQFIKLS